MCGVQCAVYMLTYVVTSKVQGRGSAGLMMSQAEEEDLIGAGSEWLHDSRETQPSPFHVSEFLSSQHVIK